MSPYEDYSSEKYHTADKCVASQGVTSACPVETNADVEAAKARTAARDIVSSELRECILAVIDNEVVEDDYSVEMLDVATTLAPMVAVVAQLREDVATAMTELTEAAQCGLNYLELVALLYDNPSPR